jgi:hypothetical protein
VAGGAGTSLPGVARGDAGLIASFTRTVYVTSKPNAP